MPTISAASVTVTKKYYRASLAAGASLVINFQGVVTACGPGGITTISFQMSGDGTNWSSIMGNIAQNQVGINLTFAVSNSKSRITSADAGAKVVEYNGWAFE